MLRLWFIWWTHRDSNSGQRDYEAVRPLWRAISINDLWRLPPSNTAL